MLLFAIQKVTQSIIDTRNIKTFKNLIDREKPTAEIIDM